MFVLQNIKIDSCSDFLMAIFLHVAKQNQNAHTHQTLKIFNELILDMLCLFKLYFDVSIEQKVPKDNGVSNFYLV